LKVVSEDFSATPFISAWSSSSPVAKLVSSATFPGSTNISAVDQTSALAPVSAPDFQWELTVILMIPASMSGTILKIFTPYWAINSNKAVCQMPVVGLISDGPLGLPSIFEISSISHSRSLSGLAPSTFVASIISGCGAIKASVTAVEMGQVIEADRKCRSTHRIIASEDALAGMTEAQAT